LIDVRWVAHHAEREARSRLSKDRHCERSEAIQSALAAKLTWIASSLSLLAMTKKVQRQSFPIVMAGINLAIHVLLGAPERHSGAPRMRRTRNLFQLGEIPDRRSAPSGMT
jgi:hypothetical protein